MKFSIETYLKIRNLASIKENSSEIPERFKNVVTKEEYTKSINYNSDRLKFSIITSLFSVGVLLMFTIGGLLNSLTEIVIGVTSSNVIGAVLLGLLLIIISEII
jgi:cytochrome c biogenesis protein CcdA